MRIVLLILLVLGLVGPGCARRKAVVGPVPSRHRHAIITPENTMVGKVARVNPTARIVVVSYPIGQVPPVGKLVSLYRRGLKVAEVRVCPPQLEDNTVADILAGDAEVGDEARAQ